MKLALSRTSSTTSASSDDAAVGAEASRRTRKRFTGAQLVMLEHLFHCTSHPSREQREAVAKEGGMEIKSVTIWFQNKRQTERKSALGATAGTSRATPTSSPASTPTARRSAVCLSSPLSLDCVASRSELRMVPPRTPTRRPDPHATLWDNMPSSPLAPPASPPQRDFVEFGKIKRTRTLEWACAAARLAGKEGRQDEEDSFDLDFGDDTDEEMDEAITPIGTLDGKDAIWTTGTRVSMTSVLRKETQDDDMMKAALALCGLGRGN